MNKYSKLFALLGTAFLLGSCQEDSLLQSEGPLSGNEIRFGATAHFKNGNSSTTRTEYGDIEKDENGNGFIEVRWSNGDRIDIACPSTAGTNCAEYVVSGFDHGTDKDGNNQSGAQNSTATTLTKTGDTGLQWGSSEDDYTFYSVYPSLNTIKSHLQGVMPDAELNNLGVSKEGTLAGYLAQIQDAAPASVDNALKKPTTQKDDKTGEVKTGYVIKPNMDFAYMVAKTPNVGYGNDVNLSFKSIVTALEFQIFAPDVVGETAGDITVTGFALSDPNNGDICGPFSYDYNTEKYATPDKGAASGHSLVQMNILGTEGEGVTIKKGQFVDVTFFLLPRADEQTYKTLDLTVFYKVGISSQVKTATLNRAIAPRTKTYIKNIKLPQITNVNASSWWSALPPATLFSQVSIPVAGNVYATSKYNNSRFYQQQSKTISQLWSMGVRGFELCCKSALVDRDSPEGILKKNLGDEYILVAEKPTSVQFKTAVTELINLHSTEGYENEPLVLLCTYVSAGDGYNPYNYVANLLNYFATLDEEIQEKFVRLTTSTTAGDLRGKIAVIIRPGDDLRWLYETNTYNGGSVELTDPYTQLDIQEYKEGLTAQIYSALNTKTEEEFPGKNILGKTMIISDWGASSYDMWNRRYGVQYGMDETSYKKLTSARKNELAKLGISTMFMESYLYASNRDRDADTYAWSGQNDDNNFNNFGGAESVVVPSYGAASASTDIAEFNFEHSMSNGGKAFVQEWQRVVPDGGIPATKLHSGGINFIGDSRYSIWVKWPGSTTEKKEAIKDLFNKSVVTKGTAGNDLYINMLSGYYATTDHAPSITPITESITTSRGTKNDFTEQGKGGDYAALATELNQYVYELLTATPGGDGSSRAKLKQQGPWGLVVMDHIGTDGDDGYSTKLVDLIMMNNFRFPLAVGSYEEPAPPTVKDPDNGNNGGNNGDGSGSDSSEGPGEGSGEGL